MYQENEKDLEKDFGLGIDIDLLKDNGLEKENDLEKESGLDKESELGKENENGKETDLENGSYPDKNETHHSKENGVCEPDHNTEGLVEVDRTISVFEWFTILTGPLVMPVFGVFIVFFGVKTDSAMRRGERAEAVQNRAMLVGLGHWAYRVSFTFVVFALVFVALTKFERFSGG